MIRLSDEYKKLTYEHIEKNIENEKTLQSYLFTLYIKNFKIIRFTKKRRKIP